MRKPGRPPTNTTVDTAKLRAFRADHGLTQRELDERAGLPSGTTAKAEQRGRVSPDNARALVRVVLEMSESQRTRSDSWSVA